LSDGHKAAPPFRRWLNLLKRGHWFREIGLTPLSAGHTSEMIAAMLQNQQPARVLRDYIFGESQGNPWFILEYMKFLVASRVLIRKNREWLVNRDLRRFTFAPLIREFGQPARPELPAALHSSFREPFERLTLAEKKALQAMAMIGDSFHFDWILALSAIDEEELLDMIDVFRRLEILREDAEVEDYFHFVYPQFRESILAELTPETVREFARRCSSYFEGLGKLPKKDRAIRLAVYFQQAEQPESMRRWALTAARQLKNAGLFAEARYYAERLSSASPAPEDSPHIRDQLEALGLQAEIAHILTDYPQSLNAYREALTITRATRDLGGEAEILQQMAETYHSLSLFQKALLAQKKSLGLAKDLGRLDLILKNYLGFCRWFLDLGNIRSAEAYIKKAGLLVQADTPPELTACYQNSLGEVLLERRDLAGARQLFDRAGRAAARQAWPELEIITARNQALVMIQQGNIDLAGEYVRQSLHLAQRAAFRFREIQARITYARLAYLRGDYDTAIREAAGAIRQRGKKYSRYPVFEAYVLIGLTHTILFNLDKAFDFFNEALDIIKNIRGRLNGELLQMFMLKTEIRETYQGMQRLMEELGLTKEAEKYRLESKAE
jgi:tetratricopeptide (TPR) repeat protein